MTAQQVEPGQQVAGAPDASQTDPVCGMNVNGEPSTLRFAHKGVSYRFCSADCRTKFRAAPETYNKPKPAPEPAKPDAVFTCPMHPEVRLLSPGSCPICGNDTRTCAG